MKINGNILSYLTFDYRMQSLIIIHNIVYGPKKIGLGTFRAYRRDAQIAEIMCIDIYGYLVFMFKKYIYKFNTGENT